MQLKRYRFYSLKTLSLLSLTGKYLIVFYFFLLLYVIYKRNSYLKKYILYHGTRLVFGFSGVSRIVYKLYLAIFVGIFSHKSHQNKILALILKLTTSSRIIKYGNNI